MWTQVLWTGDPEPEFWLDSEDGACFGPGWDIKDGRVNKPHKVSRFVVFEVPNPVLFFGVFDVGIRVEPVHFDKSRRGFAVFDLRRRYEIWCGRAVGCVVE